MQVDTSGFREIQHYTDQSIDFSHHFHCRFSDFDDIARIVQRHGLSRDTSAGLIVRSHLPDWCAPDSVTTNAQQYATGGSESLVLIVDPNRKIAYFEMVHL